MTRGQDALVVETQDEAGVAMSMQVAHLAGFSLPVIAASEADLLAHSAVLAELDKASGGKTVWRVAAVA